MREQSAVALAEAKATAEREKQERRAAAREEKRLIREENKQHIENLSDEQLYEIIAAEDPRADAAEAELNRRERAQIKREAQGDATDLLTALRQVKLPTKDSGAVSDRSHSLRAPDGRTSAPEVDLSRKETTNANHPAWAAQGDTQAQIQQVIDADKEPTYQLRAFREKRYQAAKKSGTTKLTEHQWQQVHTPQFKAWFGDWERLRAQQKADAMEPVALALDEKYKDASTADLRKAVVAHLRELAQAGVKANHPELGEVGFANSKIGKVINTSAANEKLHATLDIVRAIEAAHLVESNDSDKAKHAEHGVLYHTLAAKTSAFGREFVTIITVEEAPTGSLFYNNIAVEDGHKKASRTSPRNSESEDSAKTSALHEAFEESKLSQLDRVNPESVSRAVDAQTGEPLVVYHSTGEKFRVFDITRSRSWTGEPDYDLPGFYFTDDQQQSSDYGSHVIAAYLSLQRPFTADISRYKAERGLATWRETYEQLRKDGYDGVIDWDAEGEAGGREFIAFAPEQIKSAVGNRGTFDPANPDITYQLRSTDWEGFRVEREEKAKAQAEAALRADKKRQAFEATGVPQSLADEITARLERIRARELGKERLSASAVPVAAARREAGFFTRVARRALDAWAEPVARRLEKMHPVLGQQLRRLEFEMQRGRVAAHERVRGFVDGLLRLAQSAPADYAALDLALKNGEVGARDAVLIKHGLAEAWGGVEFLLRSYHARLTGAGFKVGFLEHYFPRKVRDADGLLAYYAGDDEAVSVINERNAAQGEREPAGFFSGVPQNLKERTVWRVRPQTARFYDRLLSFGYTAERLRTSIAKSDPLSEIPKELRKQFLAELSPFERRQLERAYIHYAKIDTLRGHERQLFPSKTQPLAWQKHHRPRPDLLQTRIQTHN